ncbi:hypothetical protein F5Y16DRAFT_414589 [Xylariaceae sp. FL0255]|nr:hypothetical protein F5Y16DRAFT_414589 [Xylariaceae sp. FL0255]
MSRASIVRQPLRHALSRPLAGQTRYILPGLMTTRSQASVNEAKPTAQPRYPRSVQALYLQPLRRQAEFGVPSCDLQLRSYSIPNLEFFCDFALRAAYYLGLPAFGPVPLPKITERWTVPRSHFIFKKSQENFERITRRRLIQIRDGHPETVQVWLAFLQKHAYYGIGMKANMWEYCSLDVGKQMDAEAESMQKAIDEKMDMLGATNTLGTVEKVKEMMAVRRCCQGRPASTTRRLVQIAAQRRQYSSSGEPENVIQESSIKENPPSQGHAVVFSGIQPTEEPHLGNYLGAMKQWKRLQDHAGPDDKLFFSIVDLHAITLPQDPEALRTRKLNMLASFIACGLDPEKSTLFYQSSVPQHSELMWILSCTASMGYLSRMTQFKDKLMKDNKSGNLEAAMAKSLKLGLYSYPVLQAADILVHRATHVPVGADQAQHLEFARECVTNFNHTYGTDVLIPPETVISPAPRIMSLTDPREKMSKSSLNHRSRITLRATEYEIERRLKSATTDSDFNLVTYDPENRPGVSNLLEILACCTNSTDPDGNAVTPEQIAESLHGATLLDLKQRTIAAVKDELGGYRERFYAALDHNGGKYLRDVEAFGAETARKSAGETMLLVKHAVGLS